GKSCKASGLSPKHRRCISCSGRCPLPINVQEKLIDDRRADSKLTCVISCTRYSVVLLSAHSGHLSAYARGLIKPSFPLCIKTRLISKSSKRSWMQLRRCFCNIAKRNPRKLHLKHSRSQMSMEFG